MSGRARKTAAQKPAAVYERIRQILQSARAAVARSVNTSQVVANWLIGREIVEEQQRGQSRAGYGEMLLQTLAGRLQKEFGAGFSAANLRNMRQFYLVYPSLVDAGEICYAPRSKSARGRSSNPGRPIRAPPPPSLQTEGGDARPDQSWQPGRLHSSLSWTHYRALLRVDLAEARSFYEIEALENHWSARELERQVNSLLYQRLALSRDRPGLLRLATKGQEVARADDVFKDPTVIEFLGLPESPRLVESELEAALLNNLQEFLLELGKGFAFLARQSRITLGGDHFYADLVFYHTILKCFVLIDLKIGKLTHGDLGQLQLYVNFYDRHRRSEGDNPTLGLILCTDKNDAVVRYTLGPDPAFAGSLRARKTVS